MTTPLDPADRDTRARAPFPGDTAAPALTAYQVQRCASIIQAYRRGHHAYAAALDSIADLLLIAGLTAALPEPNDDHTTALAEAWADVDGWPWPRHGAPVPQPD